MQRTGGGIIPLNAVLPYISDRCNSNITPASLKVSPPFSSILSGYFRNEKSHAQGWKSCYASLTFNHGKLYDLPHPQFSIYLIHFLSADSSPYRNKSVIELSSGVVTIISTKRTVGYCLTNKNYSGTERIQHYKLTFPLFGVQYCSLYHHYSKKESSKKPLTHSSTPSGLLAAATTSKHSATTPDRRFQQFPKDLFPIGTVCLHDVHSLLISRPLVFICCPSDLKRSAKSLENEVDFHELLAKLARQQRALVGIDYLLHLNCVNARLLQLLSFFSNSFRQFSCYHVMMYVKESYFLPLVTVKLLYYIS